MKVQKVLTLWLLTTLSLTWLALLMPQAQATNNTKILSISSINAPEPKAYRIAFFKDKMFVTTSNASKVWRYDGSWGSGSWTETLQVKSTLPAQSPTLNTDGVNSMFTHGSINDTHNYYFFTTDGLSWSNYTDLSYSGSFTFDQANLGNGTWLCVGYGDPDGVLIRKSDNWGQTWSLWKNLTALFPNCALKYATGNKPLWRHAHSIGYGDSGNYIAVSSGDAWRALVVSRDGGNTWTVERWSAPTGIYSGFSDRMVFTGDQQETNFIYLYGTGEYRDVKLQGWTRFQADHPTYDSVNNVLYAGISRGNGTHGIIASPDKGESWISIYKWSEGSGTIIPWFAYSNGYLYYVKGGSNDGEVYRFEALPNEAVRALDNTTVKAGFYDSVLYYDFGNASQIADVQVSWTKFNMKNIVNNSDMEDGMKTSGFGFPSFYKVSFDNASCVANSTAGLNGSTAIQLTFNGTGNYVGIQGKWTNLADRAKVANGYGILAMAWIKSDRVTETTRISLRYEAYNSTGSSCGTGSWSDVLAVSTEWRKVVGYIYLSTLSNATDYYLGIPHLVFTASYETGQVNLPQTTVWVDNVTFIPVPKSMWNFGYYGMYNFFDGLAENKVKWGANGTVINTETPVVKVNDVQVSNGEFLEAVRSPLKVEVVQGGCLLFTFTPVNTLVECDSAITASSINDMDWTLTVFASSGQTSTTKLHYKGEPKRIEGVTRDAWSYDYQTETTIVTITHASSKTFTVVWREGATGTYFLTVGVIRGGLPVMGANVSCGGQPPKRTDLLGHVVFELPYGSYSVSVTVGEETQTKEVLVSQSMTVGFQFESAPSGSKGFDADLILVPVLIFGLGFVIFMFMRKR